MKVLVLDTVHGGKILAERLQKDGNDVTAVDVYKVTPRDILSNMRNRGIRILPAAPEEHFDLIVRPCHCPDSFIAPATADRIEFVSEAVHDLIKDKRFRIEITGVKGKTSTCYVLAHILDGTGKKVFLHTSRGMGPFIGGKHYVTDLQSIAPTTLIALPKGEYDILVCEVSLGGSGKADIAGITNLLEDYGIAKNTRTAEVGKKDIITEKGVTVVPENEKDLWSKYGKPLVTYGKRVSVIGVPEFAKPLKVSVEYDGTHEIELKGSYLALQYLDAMSMALEICSQMQIPVDTVLNGLRSFNGVPGRGEVSVKDGIRYLNDRNPGISHMSVGRTLSCVKELGAIDGAVLVIDPVSKKVCDKLDKDLIKQVADSYGVPMVLTPGDGSAPEIPEGAKTVVMMVKEGYQ